MCVCVWQYKPPAAKKVTSPAVSVSAVSNSPSSSRVPQRSTSGLPSGRTTTACCDGLEHTQPLTTTPLIALSRLFSPSSLFLPLFLSPPFVDVFLCLPFCGVLPVSPSLSRSVSD